MLNVILVVVVRRSGLVTTVLSAVMVGYPRRSLYRRGLTTNLYMPPQTWLRPSRFSFVVVFDSLSPLTWSLSWLQPCRRHC